MQLSCNILMSIFDVLFDSLLFMKSEPLLYSWIWPPKAPSIVDTLYGVLTLVRAKMAE